MGPGRKVKSARSSQCRRKIDFLLCHLNSLLPGAIRGHNKQILRLIQGNRQVQEFSACCVPGCSVGKSHLKVCPDLGKVVASMNSQQSDTGQEVPWGGKLPGISLSVPVGNELQ